MPGAKTRQSDESSTIRPELENLGGTRAAFWVSPILPHANPAKEKASRNPNQTQP